MRVLFLGTNNYSVLLEMLEYVNKIGYEAVVVDFDNGLVENFFLDKIKKASAEYHFVEGCYNFEAMSNQIDGLHERYKFTHGITSLTFVIEFFSKKCHELGIRFTKPDVISAAKDKHYISKLSREHD